MSEPDSRDPIPLQKETGASGRPKYALPAVLGGSLGLAALVGAYAYTKPREKPAPAPVHAAAVHDPDMQTPPVETAEEKADDERRYQAQAMQEQVQELLCQETAQRYMKATTAIQLQRSIHISQANGCGWKYIMAADARTHDLTPEALEAASGIEEHDVPAVDGDESETRSKLDEMSRKLSDQDSELSRLRYRSNYR